MNKQIEYALMKHALETIANCYGPNTTVDGLQRLAANTLQALGKPAAVIYDTASSWEGEVDRQSGAFTQEEISNSTAWR
jgi:hypothetical protein